MPLYEFQSEDGKRLLVEMDTKQPAEAYRVQVRDGKKYKRVYDVPRLAHDMRVGTSESEFIRATSGKNNITVAQMQELSREMHEKRTDSEGIDQVKEAFYEKYEKDIGTKHKNVARREKLADQKSRLAKAKKKLEKFGVEVKL